MKKNRTDNFDKFSLKKKGSAVKENIRQDKKKAKAESRAMGEAARQRKIDKARGIVTDPPKEKYSKGPHAKKTTGYEKKPSTRKSFQDAPPKYGELTPSHTTRPTTARPATTNKRTPASMDKADEKRTASIGKVNAASDTPYEQMPLNKYIAHAGISGRREAAAMVKSGHVTINGDTILEPGYKVQYKDVVRLKGKVLQLVKESRPIIRFRHL
jgi:23S rRNA pseudouridine2605 synthase